MSDLPWVRPGWQVKVVSRGETMIGNVVNVWTEGDRHYFRLGTVDRQVVLAYKNIERLQIMNSSEEIVVEERIPL